MSLISNCTVRGNAWDLQTVREGFLLRQILQFLAWKLIKKRIDDEIEPMIISQVISGHWAQYPTAHSKETLEYYGQLRRVFTSLNFFKFWFEECSDGDMELTIISQVTMGHSA